MHRQTGICFLAGWLLAIAVAAESKLELPWREAGLSERQAAAHLLDRLAFGPRPGDVERIMKKGLEAWLSEQLDGDLPDPEVAEHLADLASLELSNRQIAERYPQPARVISAAREAGVISDEASFADRDMTEENLSPAERSQRLRQRRELIEFARARGYRPARQLVSDLIAQKLYRAIYSENRLTEALTDFWFNHFNVSISNNLVRPFVSTYERDAIRPHVLGHFGDMLIATARHPAMLFYLDNARSVAPEGTPTTLGRKLGGPRGRRAFFGSSSPGRDRQARRAPADRNPQRQRPAQQRSKGLNENYARELMELHTLGVDGGYAQQDVVEVARAFTGWTAYPPFADRDQLSGRIAKARRLGAAGFVFEEDFIFRADAHDAAEKTVLGKTLAAGRGIEDGEDVLAMLAAHPSTARHVATKMAVRFVTEEPPADLVERLAKTFLDTRGDLRRVMATLVESPEFWAPEARRQKIKSPFELAVSALRATDAEVTSTRGLSDWISRMGQPLYAYQAPTGYPDRAEAWVNTGSLLARMNFGLQLASGGVRGVDLDLVALNGGREPESLDEALAVYITLLMPERDASATLRQLEPMVRDPRLAHKLEGRAPARRDEPLLDREWEELLFGDETADNQMGQVAVISAQLGQVVGLVLGSPEFQRR